MQDLQTPRRSKRKSPASKTNTSIHEQEVPSPISDMAEPFQELQEEDTSSAEATRPPTRKSQRISQRRGSQIVQPLAPVSLLANKTPTRTPKRKTQDTPSEASPLRKQKIADGTPVTSLSRQLVQLKVQEKFPENKQETADTPARNTRNQKRNRSALIGTTLSKTISEIAAPKRIDFGAPASMQATGESKEEDVCLSPTAFVLSKNEKVLRKALKLDELPEDAPISAAMWQAAFLAKPYRIPELMKGNYSHNTRRIFALIAALTGDPEQLELALTDDIESLGFPAHEWGATITRPLTLLNEEVGFTIMTPLTLAAERGAVDVLTALQERGWPTKEDPNQLEWLTALRNKAGKKVASAICALKDFFEQRYASYEMLDEQSTKHLIKVGEMILDESTADTGHCAQRLLKAGKILLGESTAEADDSIRPPLTVLLLKTAETLEDYNKISEIQADILKYDVKNPTATLYKVYADAKFSEKTDLIKPCYEALHKIYPGATIPETHRTEIAIAWRHIARAEQRLGNQQNAADLYNRAENFDSNVSAEADALKPTLAASSRSKSSLFRENPSTAVSNPSQQQATKGR